MINCPATTASIDCVVVYGVTFSKVAACLNSQGEEVLLNHLFKGHNAIIARPEQATIRSLLTCLCSEASRPCCSRLRVF